MVFPSHDNYGQKQQINKNGYIGINRNSKYYTSDSTVDDGLILSVSNTVNSVKKYVNYRLIDIIDTESESSDQTWSVPNYGNIPVRVFKIKNIGTEVVSALIEKTIDTKTKSLHKYKLNEIVLDDYVFINSIVGVNSNNVEKTLVLNTDYTFLVKYKIIKLIGDYVTVKVDGIRYDFREASADCLEMIANNFRRLNQFSVMNNSQNLDDTKRFLLDAASRLRKVRGLR